MTNGTSQGLFVVVATVIFGIFVTLSYTVFGSDGLSGGITGLFEESIEMVESNLKRYEPVNGFDMSHIVNASSPNWVYNEEENEITFSNREIFSGGLYIPEHFTEPNKTYTLSFNVQKLSGDIEGIGGHLQGVDSSNVRVRLNGRRTQKWEGNRNPSDSHDWSKSIVYPNDGEVNKIEVTFTTRDTGSSHIYIQPNRSPGGYAENGLEYSISISNVELLEHINRGGN